MKPTRGDIAKHFTLIIGIVTLLVLVMLYPFLFGGYDRLAAPLSTMVQVFGVVGLPLVLIGLLWLTMPGHGFIFAVVSVAAGMFVTSILALFATLSVGNAFGILTLTVGAYVFFRLIPAMKRLKNAAGAGFTPAPLYLISLPVFTLVFQLALAAPAKEWSRDHAIANASEFISDIEEYRAEHGRYPVSLQAQNKDYYPDIVGVERYLYAQQGDGYNLSFEQPRFLLDRFGTREWVVFNPRDEHRVYSHVAWLLPSPEAAEPSQGWYASGDTAHPHWKYFLFD